MAGEHKDDQEITKAAALLRAGKLVAFPTETVYGLGADATNDAAVSAIFAAKGRPSTNPLIVHVASFDELVRCVDLSNTPHTDTLVRWLHALKPLWPGPLSVVVPKAPHISSVVSAGGASVAVRIPRHPMALQLLTACGKPLAAPSANPSMYISPTTAQHVRDTLGDKVAYVLDGGPCEVGIESTVISLLGDTPTILRPGAVTKEQLEAALGCNVHVGDCNEPSTTVPLLSPGMLAKHYAPHTPVALLPSISLETQLPKRIGVILFSPVTPNTIKPLTTRVISESRNLDEVATRLFAALRELDSEGLDLIVVDTCEPVGLGAAIMDRLLRAAR